MLSQAYAATEFVSLDQNESFLIKDKNITLLGISDDEKSVLVCVNNEKAILSSDKTLNKVGLSLRKANETSARLKISYKCPNCVCSSDCSNDLCSSKAASEITANEEGNESAKQEIITQKAKNIRITKENPSQITKEKSASMAIALAFILILFIIFLILIRKHN